MNAIRIIAALACGASALVLAASASASPQMTGSGTFTVTGTLAGCGPVDGTFLTEGQGYIDASGESVIDGHTRRVDNASSESAPTVMTWHTVGAAGTYEIMYHR